ncbi:MAG: GDP-mannose 4,6-dehydratase [Candidatus Beckwithbacteria bacterium GW2011_GWB1_47_15]|uniref:GDP-mannose 4,6-dehydratase n=1 Tax=Candidatus Beckwithbacteria bacterium GW2011_GWB1_47_15 TaxID=1618371 RepID=A0A0G1RUL0_9BACT|nr:MAG: GDP-mannose 4,6-dehydratase, GDPmannose 4,6-dehydratase [Candidatus Beckwithbacteria bacterium GW2011_GWC1_49_16]KKU35755.1 MAG: GDP-mannose 4,6-dehydratase [Candidatus Beckwithbacteria bacterium GW2011_GWA1_46_30]KKU61009.1 MAG: GDP-mannose 4,6-dehydratase [Candidatus Beckwithbacteria bacterium GW2011_GWB1_47_15]KKU72314.1 MAG: GDP-mannose 4,6-dehydratase [Candidatus Beckwithbacteria bacterium GW2011_GWA2_47_25]KKW04926.1 MAG: GDP-mannose 4,6-dehydratase [Candidatus Beckwithbacteria ba
MTKTAFITGITGQDGSYLAEFLLKKNYRVVGLVSRNFDIGQENIAAVKDKLILETGDLLNQDSLKKILKSHRPQEIYNLAGVTFVPKSWEIPSLYFDVNLLGLSRLLELVRDDLPQARLYQATSAKIFGVPRQTPQTETTPLNPVDPYSISKAGAHLLTKSFRSQFNLFAVSGILFNHESERRGLEFVTRKITHTAAKIKLKLTDKLTLGSLDAEQDWGYAPDYVEAMWLMLQQDSPEDYVIASGQPHTVRDVCQVAFSHLGLNYQKFVTIDKKFFRKTESKAVVGDTTKAKTRLGWQPKVSFEAMIKKMVDYDLGQLKKS